MTKARAHRQSKPGKSRRVVVPPQPRLFGLPQPLVAGLLLLLVVASGAQVADQAHQVRRLHSQLEVMGKRYNDLLAENTRLRLERGARASYTHVEQVAQDDLAMHFPEQIVTIVAGSGLAVTAPSVVPGAVVQDSVVAP